MSLSGNLGLRVAIAAALSDPRARGRQTVAGAEAKKSKTLKLNGDDTALTPDAETFAALAGAGFSVAPVGAAEAREDGSIAFPITRGRVNSKTLRASSPTVVACRSRRTGRRWWHVDFVIRTGRGRPSPHRQGRRRAADGCSNCAGIERPARMAKSS